jgi:hypothetical protein
MVLEGIVCLRLMAGDWFCKAVMTTKRDVLHHRRPSVVNVLVFVARCVLLWQNSHSRSTGAEKLNV